jgi:hypothetical protein
MNERMSKIPKDRSRLEIPAEAVSKLTHAFSRAGVDSIQFIA